MQAGASPGPHWDPHMTRRLVLDLCPWLAHGLVLDLEAQGWTADGSMGPQEMPLLWHQTSQQPEQPCPDSLWQMQAAYAAAAAAAAAGSKAQCAAEQAVH